MENINIIMSQGSEEQHPKEVLTPEQVEEHKVALLPWIESPLQNVSSDDLTLELRHESSRLELCFDLFFIANLSTYTSTHSIVDTSTLVAYIGLFAIIWFTWFQITLYDVRFSVDSVWERFCKLWQFVIFVGFALVGSSFNPGGKEHNNTSFRILCYLLFISRILFAIQYGVALFFIKKKTKALTWPLSLTITALVLMAGAFYSMVPAFSSSSGNGLGIYYVWYIILGIELTLIIGLSSIWRQLGFKKTHLMERMGLLTLIVIGEGAIGVTKTVAKLMGKSGATPEGCLLIICIILIMMFLWQLYFDNHPEHHPGTIRQQLWAFLHFPLHIGIIGVLEGSQQIAIARSIFTQLMKIESAIHTYCVTQNLDGNALVDAITKAVKELKLEDKLESKAQAALVYSGISNLAGVTEICSPTNTTGLSGKYDIPDSFADIMLDVFGALFQATGINLPKDIDPTTLASSTYMTVYAYYWASIALTFVSFLVLFCLTSPKEHRAVLFERVAIGNRIVAAIVAVIGGSIAANRWALYTFIRSPGILILVAGVFGTVLLVDRIGRRACVARLRAEGVLRDDAGTNAGSIKLRPLTEHGSARSLTSNSNGYVRAVSMDSRRSTSDQR